MAAAALIPLLNLGLQAGGLGLGFGQSRYNAKQQRIANDQERAFTKEMYYQQRMDNLIDWQLQNKYNHPLQQMKRLQEAGLNPQLIYGSGSTTPSATVKSASPSSSHFTPPQSTVDPSILTGAMAHYQDARLQQQQIDNLKTQQQLMQAQTTKTLTEGERGSFELGKAKEFKDSLFQLMTMEIAKKQAETSNIGTQQEFSQIRINQKEVELAIRKNEYQLKKASTMAQIQETHERILKSIVYRQTNPLVRDKMLQEIEIMKKSGQLRDVEIQLRNLGLEPGSPEWINRYIDLLKNFLSIGK